MTMMTATNKHSAFDALITEVKACRKCARMCDSARVLNYSAGNLKAELLFVGEAPGRLGADETEVPFHGDKTGHNFEELLAFSGINRAEVFVTNAVLCNPRDEAGNNSAPSTHEILNCSSFLLRQIELVDPKIIVTLGATALKSLGSISEHGLTLSTHVRTSHIWKGRQLIPLYHPGQRAMIHRSFANQRSDYQFVAEQLRRLTIQRRKGSGSTKADLLSVARYLLTTRPEMSYFELHKYAYLAEYVHVKRTGRRLTSGYFIRQKDGPYCTDLQVDKIRRSDPCIRISNRKGRLYVSLIESTTHELFQTEEAYSLTDEVKKTIDETLTRYVYSSEGELKTAVYLTAPMRYLLRREVSSGSNQHNAPIDFLAAR